MNKVIFFLLALSLLLAAAIGYLFYERSKEHVVIEGRFILLTVDPEPDTFYVRGKDRAVPDTTMYQRYLDSLYRATKEDSSARSIVDALSRPFGDKGKQGRISYDITAFPQLDKRAIDVWLDMDPIEVDTTISDTTKYYYADESHPTWWEVIAFVLGVIFGGLF